ncbi:MAG: glycine--tRNA ligase, partial [Burkholderiales bacterium]|nr:glycine--tRNA ligase [Burkholderiales bacterium]
MKTAVQEDLFDRIVSLCKRRGFVYPGSEIYGGLANCWDYGPLGSQFKKNVKDLWWRTVVQERDDMVGLDAAILMHPRTWVASGHAEAFSDPLVDCRKCKQRYRADDLEPGAPCPQGGSHDLTEVRQFNLMFETRMGVVQDEASRLWLRPETAQGIFVNFKNVQTTSRKKLPFGIAQIGKSFRNEITPRRFIFRTREFEQMEVEYFVHPEQAEKAFEEWVQARHSWYLDYGIRPENLRLRPHDPDELAHYARGCYDIEYLFPWGWAELEGIANRTDFDLRRHAEYSGKDLEYFDPDTNEHIVPWVIEPSGGVDRAALAFLVDSFHEDTAISAKGQEENRVVLRLHPRLAPVQVAVLPLLRNKPELVGMARKIQQDLRRHYLTDYDDRGQIGKRYRRQDEVGTPLCLTVDFTSLDDETIT